MIGKALPQSMAEVLALPLDQSPRVTIEPLDVADCEAGTELARRVQERFGPIDIPVNNAGISYRSTVEDCAMLPYCTTGHWILEGILQSRQKKGLKGSLGGRAGTGTERVYPATKRKRPAGSGGESSTLRS